MFSDDVVGSIRGKEAFPIAINCDGLSEQLFWVFAAVRDGINRYGYGALAIFVWNKWAAPTTGIHGVFVCMVTNGLAMVVAHHLLPQPEE